MVMRSPNKPQPKPINHCKKENRFSTASNLLSIFLFLQLPFSQVCLLLVPEFSDMGIAIILLFNIRLCDNIISPICRFVKACEEILL